ncbi:MAG TPA: alkaline phosphatase family protein [Vicinamibacterales bacterium]|nr:alkaline phosphatase family protein [Vicinamibacterales bacterium]
MTTPESSLPHSSPRKDAASVDELRQRLRSLGYLDAGVDRFVLGPARETRRPLTIAALASVRTGLLAAALLGPAAAVGLRTRLPGLMTGPRDAAVVALYLALFFGVAATAFAFVASLLATHLPLPVIARRPRLVSRLAGGAVGGACLVYLTLWWRIASVDAAALSPLWTAFVLAIAVAISLLLGHATTITAFAVLAASHGGPGQPAVPRQSAWRLTAAAAVLAFAGAAALLLVAAPAPAGTPAPNLAVVSPGLHVKLIAIDGFDPAVMETLAQSGRVPGLARLFSGGAIRLAADAVRDPAREWTTVATGQPPDVHGVHGLETRRVAGLQGSVTSVHEQGLASALRGATDLLRLTRPSTASGTELRSKTIWEVAADAGLRTAVVNWWATWPATSTGANPPVVISDRATLRLERGGALDGEIAPEAVYDRLRADWPVIKTEAAARMAALLPVAADPETSAALRRAAEIDALQLAMASRLDSPPLDLLALYLPGLDIAQHALLGSGNAVSPSALAARLEGLRNYYVYLDGLLREAIVPAPGEMVIAIAQPGRIATITQGLMAASGEGAAGGVGADGRTIDIAPTVLHALGIPVSRELAGTPILGIFSSAFVARFPVRDVETYGRRAAPAGLREGQPLDREMIERLRSLGYVR